jgi:ABC-type polysaccharide/polyol phosphate transport system ATPase subunit
VPVPAIRVDNLSKQYQIGARQPGYTTFREVISSFVTNPFHRFRSLSGRGDAAQLFWALKAVSFEVQPGEVVGIIGRNGAGKTTLLKILSQITAPTEGRAEINGRVVSLLEVGTGFHPELTGRENIYLNGAILGMSRSETRRKFDEIVRFADVEKFLDTPVKRYSSGMYIRLAFSVAAHLEPEILIVDEVLAVGDAQFQRKCLGKMGDAARSGRTVLFVSHNMAAVSALCEKAILLENGRVVRDGSASHVVDEYNQAVLRAGATNGASPTFFTDEHEIGIANCSVSLTSNADGELDLELCLDVIAKKPCSNVGVGCQISTLSGARVSTIAPMMTNFQIDSARGRCRCTFHCQSVSRYLAGGEYAVTFWLSRPRIETLLVAENALRLSIPPSDPYQHGMYFECEKHGFVPLRATFTVDQRPYC